MNAAEQLKRIFLGLPGQGPAGGVQPEHAEELYAPERGGVHHHPEPGQAAGRGRAFCYAPFADHGQKLEGRIIIGLYVHLCCLVERLVTKTSIENYQDLDEFQRKHGDFIGWARECFRTSPTTTRWAAGQRDRLHIRLYPSVFKNKMIGRPSFGADREDE